MFTGIIRELGRVVSADRRDGGARVHVDAPRTAPGLALGASVAVDGVCLTVAAREAGGFACDLVPETMARTTWGARRAGDLVNVEAALRLGDAIDGHLVQGHVDGVGVVSDVAAAGLDWVVTIAPPAELLPSIAEKGSIAVNGVSLTVASAPGNSFTVALIPTTLEETNLKGLKKGSRVNLEVDLFARYVARILERRGR